MAAAIPTLTPVTRSSTIAGTGYDAETQVLTIRFKGGSIYQYQRVEPWMYAKLLAAPSIGSWFASHIKSNPTSFPCTKLDTKPRTVEDNIPSFYATQPVAVLLADAAEAAQAVEREISVQAPSVYGRYQLVEHLAALLIARDEIVMSDIAAMSLYVRQARRALGFMPAVDS